VPAGRLSCAACGTLLASVAGSERRSTQRGPATDATGAALGDAVDAAAESARHARDAKAWTTGMDAAEDVPIAAKRSTKSAKAAAAAPPTPAILKDWAGPDPLGEKTLFVPRSEPIPSLPTGTPSAWTPPVAAAAAPTEPAVVPATPDESWDTEPDDGEPVHPPEPADLAMPAPDPGDGPSWPPAPSVPGAYVAPAIVPTAAAMVNGRPATAASIAAAAVADGTLASIAAEPRPDRWYSVPSAKDGGTPGKAGLFSDLPFRTPKDLPGWAVAVASLVGAVAFVLPFSGGYVIGGGVDTTYFGLWGLSNPANLVLMLLSIALLFVTLIPSRIPVSIRAVVLPILLGGWFLGIVWSYATGPFGLGLGVDAIGIAGIVLVIGGALAAARADDPPKPTHEPDAA
jgi:hypothetical protein